MKNKFFTSIQSKIFFTYGFIFMIVILLVSFLYIFTSNHTFIKNFTASSAQVAKVLSYEVTDYFEDMNSIQKKILETEFIREYVFELSKEKNVTYDRQFTKAIYSIVGYDFDFYHMNIVNLEDNTLITFGQKYSYEKYNPSLETQQQIIQPILEEDGNRYVIPTDQGNLYTIDPEKHVISFSRAFSRYYLTPPKGIIELQIDYKKIETLINDSILAYQDYKSQVLILDKNGQVIYPITMDKNLVNHYRSLKTSEGTSFKNKITNEKEIVATHKSDNTGVITYVITPDSSISSSRNLFRNIGIFIAAISLLLLLVITYGIAKSISSPIIELRDSIAKLELSSISPEENGIHKSNLNELEMLNQAYLHMQVRLKDSLEDIVQSKALSIHSQIMALQSQMDSHFLYNTLTVISIIAEENDDYEAAGMCMKLTQMLRYITQDFAKNTTLREEITHMKNYADLMKSRFGNKIEFIYNTDRGLDNVQIPRLLIQPLVENSVKYSRREDKILSITIKSYQNQDHWYVQVMDNGYGFSDSVLEAIYSKINLLDNTSDYQHLDLSGMGLANIYLRLKLYYTSSNFIFNISNTEQGSIITIGGSISEYQK